MRNKLIIHPAKTEAMILRITPFIGSIQPIRFDSGFVKIVTLATCLDVTIDIDLSWSIHTEKVKNSCPENNETFAKYVLQNIHFKAVIPCVTSAISVWGNCSTPLLQLLNRHPCKMVSYNNQSTVIALL